jgi:hypothetical protein
MNKTTAKPAAPPRNGQVIRALANGLAKPKLGQPAATSRQHARLAGANPSKVPEKAASAQLGEQSTSAQPLDQR